MILVASKGNVARARTPDGLWRVFAYGSLKSDGYEPAQARGRLYLRPTGQAAVDFEERERGAWVEGEVIEVDDAGLDELDRREGACCAWPFYERILIKLRDGTVCWGYQWARGFRGYQVIADGVWLWNHLRVWRARYGSNNTVSPYRQQLELNLIAIDAGHDPDLDSGPVDLT